MDQKPQVDRVRAEMLLNYLYPDLAKSWRVENRGTFYRNYSEDIISFDPNSGTVELSRDGLLKLLPPRMISGDDTHNNIKEHSQREAEELRLMSEMFVPIDSILFRLNMMTEQSVAQVMLGYEAYIIKEYFGYDLDSEENFYLRMLLPLLPFVAKLRGDYSSLVAIMERIVGHKVSFKMDCYSQSDRVGVMLMRVIFAIDVEGLDVEQYNELNRDLQPLFDTIREWFIPFDHISEFRIRDLRPDNTTISERDILGYNTRLSK